MTKRILSTVLLWLIVGGVLWQFRTTGAVLLVGAISALTLLEFYRLLAGAGLAPFARLGAVFGGVVTLAPWLAQRFGFQAEHLLALGVVLFSIRILRERGPELRVESLASTLFSRYRSCVTRARAGVRAMVRRGGQVLRCGRAPHWAGNWTTQDVTRD